MTKTKIYTLTIISIIFISNNLFTDKINNKKNTNMKELATFGSGCFWCSEAIFQSLKGVSKVVSGYSGGHVQNPTYEIVIGKQSGHAEVIQIAYNPSIISYQKLLEIFWKTHDPTTPNRQGNDVGPQYRSIILFHNQKQKELAEKSKIAAQNTLHENPIVTEIKPFSKFYTAENYHQNYYERNSSSNPYCYFVIKPKLEKFKKEFDKLLNNN